MIAKWKRKGTNSMLETFGDSGNNARVHNQVKAYTTNNKLFAEITNVPNKTVFKTGSTLKLSLGVMYQHTLEGHNVSQEQFEKADLKGSKVIVELINKAGNSKDITEQFKIVKKPKSVSATANQAIDLTGGKRICLQLVLGLALKYRTQFCCSGDEESDQKYNSIICMAVYVPHYWKIIYHLTTGDCLRGFLVEPDCTLKKVQSIYDTDQLIIGDGNKLNIIPTRNIVRIEVEKH